MSDGEGPRGAAAGVSASPSAVTRTSCIIGHVHLTRVFSHEHIFLPSLEVKRRGLEVTRSHLVNLVKAALLKPYRQVFSGS